MIHNILNEKQQTDEMGIKYMKIQVMVSIEKEEDILEQAKNFYYLGVIIEGNL